MAGFKVGDKVRCIEPFQWARGPYGPRIDVGDERTIEAINENDTLNCYSPDGEYECWNLSRFEAVPVTGVDALGLTILPDGCRERPEPVSDPEEVCPEFSHTGYCPDRLCERGCKHEAAWKVGDRVEHTIHGIGEVIYYTPVLRDRPYCVRFDEGHHGWFEAGDIQEAPPVSDTVKVEKEATDAPVWYRADEASAWANGWNACVRAAFTAEGADR